MSDFNALFASTQTVAVVGCSPRPERTSHRIARYLQRVGYRILPVNPHHEEILGERCYPTVVDIPTEKVIDVVNIFRNPRYTAEMVDHVITRIEHTQEKPIIWTQLGVSSSEAKEKAQNAELPYIENRCIMVEHRRSQEASP